MEAESGSEDRHRSRRGRMEGEESAWVIWAWVGVLGRGLHYLILK
jgi:hypothetical protein